MCIRDSHHAARHRTVTRRFLGTNITGYPGLLRRYKNHSQKIIACQSELNIESQVVRLFNAGFKGNKKYPEARLQRQINITTLTDVGEFIENEVLEARFDSVSFTNVFIAARQLLESRPRNAKIFITKIIWQIVLWTEEQQGWDVEWKVLVGPKVTLEPDKIFVDFTEVIPCSDWLQEFMKATEGYVARYKS